VIHSTAYDRYREIPQLCGAVDNNPVPVGILSALGLAQAGLN